MTLGQITDPETARSFVLVHGGSHGGWCWARVADRLRSFGHRVFTPTLTGLGERSHLTDPRTNVSTHIQDVLNVLKWERLDRVILCGHSYGGLVISGVADAAPELVDCLAFLDAGIPENGQCALDMFDSSARAALLEAVAANGGHFVPALPAELYNVNAADRQLVDTLCTPHPFASLCERLVLKGAFLKVRRKLFVRATAWHRLADGGFTRIKNDPDWTVFDLPCGHDLMLDAPDELSEILLGVTLN